MVTDVCDLLKYIKYLKYCVKQQVTLPMERRADQVSTVVLRDRSEAVWC